ncbi:arabinogalactan endo-1,4-beta-galactosidase [Paenibacillus lemnae]|uniref:Arabinogalactan endo-beta-1,4-galactanase n=1 Tax=Paenibacillus lemnae TaxID=1330551 RepID=A0A848M4A4_PAELE|nr:arabinogalactan endo-1,4-beta-galactosidase [Paenibacillus lemnae]
MEAQGYTWKDREGTERDILDILIQDYQMNSARIRVWVNPDMNDYLNGYMNAEKAAELAVRASSKGMRIMLTLHYSDSWADPGQQNKPKAWQQLSFSQLVNAVHDHTVSVMETMKAHGITPEWVQVGNETDHGMLWDDGKASEHMDQYAALVSAGHQAVKSVSPVTQTLVHVSNGYDQQLFQWNIGGLMEHGAAFDVLGMSLYPEQGESTAKVKQLMANAEHMAASYGKSIIISEIGMDYNLPEECRAFVHALNHEIKTMPEGKGLGVFYWEPQAPPGYNNGYNKGAWQTDGRPSIALEGFLE